MKINKFYLIIHILLSVFVKSFSQEFIIIDSLKVEQPSFFIYDNEFLLIGTQKGEFFQYNILNKQLSKKLNFQKAISKIEISTNYIGIVTDNELYVYEKRTFILKKEIKIDKTILGVAFINSQIYFGGKSGILFKNDIENKNSTSTEIYKTIKNDYLYWITDIDILDNNLYLCAGNLYVFKLLNKFELINEINDREKNFTICKFFKNDFYFFKSKEKLFIKNNSDFTITDILLENCYLSNTFINNYNDSTLLLTVNNKLILLDTKHKKVDTIVSNQNLILADYDSLIVYSIHNSIYFLKDISKYLKLEFNKNIILENINFEIGKTIYSNKEKAFEELNTIKSFYEKSKSKISKIKIEGHTDGDNEKLKDLSEQRASKVKMDLVELGIPENLIDTSGHGGTKPLSYDVKTNWKNRRVEIFFLKKETSTNDNNNQNLQPTDDTEDETNIDENENNISNNETDINTTDDEKNITNETTLNNNTNENTNVINNTPDIEPYVDKENEVLEKKEKPNNLENNNQNINSVVSEERKEKKNKTIKNKDITLKLGNKEIEINVINDLKIEILTENESIVEFRTLLWVAEKVTQDVYPYSKIEENNVVILKTANFRIKPEIITESLLVKKDLLNKKDIEKGLKFEHFKSIKDYNNITWHCFYVNGYYKK